MELIVYTAITNAYDVLRPTEWPSVCLSDGSVEPAEGWEIREIGKHYPNPRHIAMYPRIMAHEYFPEVEYTLYLDGNVECIKDPERMVSELRMEEDLALFAHPRRSCVYVEAAKTVELGLQGPSVTRKQIDYYQAQGLPPGAGLAATWVIVRRNTSAVRAFNISWWEDYVRFQNSDHNDQLSFGFLQWKLGMKYREIPAELFTGFSGYRSADPTFRRLKHIKYRRKGKGF